MFRFITAGESHGQGVLGVVEGFPANVPLSIDEMNQEMARRQKGYGRGERMNIEKDEIRFLSGVRGGKTIGSPITLFIENKDYLNWAAYMDPILGIEGEKKVTKPRPGHADLIGGIKYGFRDLRNVLERSSARETASRVAVGSLAKQLLKQFNIHGYSHVTAIGSVEAEQAIISIELIKKAEESPIRCADPQKEQRMIETIDLAKKDGDSLGGIFEIHMTGVPAGLGSYVQWDRKLDGLLVQALMSIQGIKGVEIGYGIELSRKMGSDAHDEIFYDKKRGYYRKTNHSGGIEGGMSNGETIVIRCAMKPIPTLRKPLKSVDIETKEEVEASVERSDVCAVPSAAVVGEMVVMTVIAQEMMKKFGQDSLEEMMKKWQGYS